jgi:hypothetical protein
MDRSGWAFLVVGVAAAVFTTWCWLGHTPAARWWSKRSGYHALVLGALPGFGILLVVAGLYRLLGSDSEPYLMALFVVGAAVLFIGVVHPSWWGPGWFRRGRSSSSRAWRG